MDVFLVPVGVDRYELYCEEPDELVTTEGAPPRGVFRRFVHRFKEMLAEAERERRRGTAASEPAGGFATRVKGRTLRWVAESIAEQRLLWQLRSRVEVRFVHPDDLGGDRAMKVLRSTLRRDFERHRFWLAIDSLGLVASAALMLLPGPNVVAYYFAFRMVGHYLSLRGARQGLSSVQWLLEASAPLSALRAMVAVAPEARAERVDEVAASLRLEHFASFFQRTASP
jgi:Mitochondrial K+-H+ exchange-related